MLSRASRSDFEPVCYLVAILFTPEGTTPCRQVCMLVIVCTLSTYKVAERHVYKALQLYTLQETVIGL